jgi:hypothetical protein
MWPPSFTFPTQNFIRISQYLILALNKHLKCLRLDVGFSPRTLGFDPWSVCVRSVVDKVALGQRSLQVHQFTPVSIILQVFYTPVPFVCPRRYTIWAAGCDVKCGTSWGLRYTGTYTQRRVVIFLPTFRDNVSVPYSREFLTLENGTFTLSRNVGKGLPLDAA